MATLMDCMTDKVASYVHVASLISCKVHTANITQSIDIISTDM